MVRLTKVFGEALGSGVMDRAEWLLAMIPPFLDAPTPEAEPSAGSVTRVLDIADPGRGEGAGEFQGRLGYRGGCQRIVSLALVSEQGA